VIDADIQPWALDSAYQGLNLDLDLKFNPHPTGHIGPHSDAINTPSMSVNSCPTSDSSHLRLILCRSLLTTLLQFVLDRPGLSFILVPPSTTLYRRVDRIIGSFNLQATIVVSPDLLHFTKCCCTAFPVHTLTPFSQLPT